MEWKNLIVFADSSEAGLTRVRAALDLAALSQAHVEARYLYKPPQIPIGFDLPALDPAYDRLVKATHAEASKAVKCVAALATLGPTFSVHAQSTGDASFSHCAALAVFGADLAVAALPESDPKKLDVVHGALFAGGAPCLLTPGWIKPHVWGRRVMIAWKATPQAARALRAALPLLARAESVRLLLVDPRGAAAGEDEDSLERIAARLLRWNARIETPILMQSNLGDAGRVIADEAERFGADLIVMGAYGHARLAEWTLGGVTQHMLQHAQAPLLMAH